MGATQGTSRYVVRVVTDLGWLQNESLGVTRGTNQSQFGQCPKKSIQEHTE
jgi:hypothetical protein